MTAPALVPGPAQTLTHRGIGASSAAAAIDCSDYSSQLVAWLEATGRVQGFAGNEKTWWGQALEPVIRAHYVEVHKVPVHVPPVSLFHPRQPYIRATPDGIVLDAAGKWLFVGPQVKNVGLRMAPLWADGATPADYLIQGVVEMAVTDLPRIDFAVLIGGQEYREVTIWRDTGLEDDVLEQLDGFWQLVESDTQPAIDGSKTFRSYALAQIKRKGMVAASSERLADLERWREVARQLKALKGEEAKLKNRIIDELAAANANRLTSDLGDITVGAPTKKTSWKAVAEELAPNVLNFRDIVAKHTTVGDPRVNRPRDWTKDLDVGAADESEEG